MTPPGQRAIDVSGLPEEAVQALESLVSFLRTGPAAGLPSYPSPEEWHKALLEWAEGHPRRDTVADDSRESIYAGRGE
jgi:hypothetical protein